MTTEIKEFKGIYIAPLVLKTQKSFNGVKTITGLGVPSFFASSPYLQCNMSLKHCQRSSISK